MTDFSKDTLKDLWAKLTEDERHFFLGDGRPPTWRESEALAANGLLEGSGGVMSRYSLTELGRALAEYGRALRDEPSTAEEWRESVRCWLRAMRIARERGITVDEDKVRELEKSLRKELSRKDLPYRVRAYLRMLDSPLPSTYEALNVLWEAMSEEEREVLNKATYGGARDYHAGRLL